MPIGLTAEELLTAYFQHLSKRLGTLTGSLEAIKAGESPDEAKLLSEFHQRFPQVSAGQLLPILCILASVMDTIVSNNVALAKTIPHLEM